MHFYPCDGAASRVGNDETAWGYRDAKWSQVVAGVSPDAGRRGAHHDVDEGVLRRAQAVRDGRRLLELRDGRADRVHGMYGSNYDRLARIKAHYDPENVFQVNQNIKPAA